MRDAACLRARSGKFPSRREVSRLHINAIGMQRPIPNLAELAELLLGQRGGFNCIARININDVLAGLAGLPLIAEYVFEEADGEMGHGALRFSVSNPAAINR